MAHDLNIRADGTAAMFSLRESPWHKLGRVLTQELKQEEVAEAAGLDWTVIEKPIYHESGGSYQAIDGNKCLMRSDTKQVMSVVSNEYRVFQNSELIDLMGRIANDTKVQWETAGALGRTGQTQWVLGYMPDLDIRVRGKNETKSYMLLTNGHGNMRSLQILPTTVRVVCQNTLSMATAGGQRTRRNNVEKRKFDKASLSTGYGIHHDGNLDSALQDVVDAYQCFIKDKVVTQEVMEQLCEVKMSQDDSIEYWNRVFGLPSADVDEAAKAKLMKQEQQRLETLQNILASPTCNTPEIAGTAYSVLQATTEFVDHHSLRRKATATSQLTHLAFGNGAKLKEKAFDEALELISA
jgi:phage/plasmid-like protein (TIGR03299 family)